MSRNTVLCMHSCAKGSQRKLQTLNHQTVLVPSVYCFWTSVVLSLKTVPKHLKHLNIAMAPWRRRRRSDDSSPSAKCLATSRLAHFSVNTLYLSISPNKRRQLVKPLWFGSSFMMWMWIWDFRTIISQQTQPQIIYSCKFPSLCYLLLLHVCETKMPLTLKCRNGHFCPSCHVGMEGKREIFF